VLIKTVRQLSCTALYFISPTNSLHTVIMFVFNGESSCLRTEPFSCWSDSCQPFPTRNSVPPEQLTAVWPLKKVVAFHGLRRIISFFIRTTDDRNKMNTPLVPTLNTINLFHISLTASRYNSLLMTNLTHSLYLCLLHLSTCFEHHSAHHQEIELY